MARRLDDEVRIDQTPKPDGRLSEGWRLVRNLYRGRPHPSAHTEQSSVHNPQEHALFAAAKIAEEARLLGEAARVGHRDGIIAKLADMEETRLAFQQDFSITDTEVERARLEKRAILGGFEDGVLQRTTEPRETGQS